MNDENSANESSTVNLENLISSKHATPEVSSLLHILLSESPHSCPPGGKTRIRQTFTIDSTVKSFPGSEDPGISLTSTVKSLPDEEFSAFRMRSALLLSSFCNAYALPVFLLQALVYANAEGIDLQNVVKVSWELDEGAERGDVDVSDFFQHKVITNPKHINLYLVTGGVITQKVLRHSLDAKKVALTISVSGKLLTQKSTHLFSAQDHSQAIVMMSQAMQFFPIYRSILSRRSDDYGITLAPYNLGVVCGVVGDTSKGALEALKVQGFMFVSGRKAEDIRKDTFFLSSNHIYCSGFSLHEIDFQKANIEHPRIPQVLPYSCSQFQPVECSSPLLIKALISRNFAFRSTPDEESNCTLLDVIFNPYRPKDSPASSSQQLSTYLTLLASACEKLIGSNARVMVYVSFQKIIDEKSIEVTHVLNIGTPPALSDWYLFKHSESKSMLCDSALENAIRNAKDPNACSGELTVSTLTRALRDLFSGADENFRFQFTALLGHSRAKSCIDECLVNNRVKVRIVTQECHPRLLSDLASLRLSPHSKGNAASESSNTQHDSKSSHTSPPQQPAGAGPVTASQHLGSPVTCTTDTGAENSLPSTADYSLPTTSKHSLPSTADYSLPTTSKHSLPSTSVVGESLSSKDPVSLPESGGIQKRYTTGNRPKKNVSFDTVEAVRVYVVEHDGDGSTEAPRFLPVSLARRKSRSSSRKLAYSPTEAEKKPSGDISSSPVRRPNTLPIPPHFPCTESAATDVPKVSVENLSLQKSAALADGLVADVGAATKQDTGVRKLAYPPAKTAKQPEVALEISDNISSSPVRPSTLPTTSHSLGTEATTASVPRISIAGLMYRSKTSPHRFNYDVGAVVQRGTTLGNPAYSPYETTKHSEEKREISDNISSSSVRPGTLSISSYSTRTQFAAPGIPSVAMRNHSIRRSQASSFEPGTQGVTVPTTLVVLIAVSFMLAAVIPVYVFALRDLCALSVPAHQCDATVTVFLLTSVILVIATTAFCEFYLLKHPEVSMAQVSNDTQTDPDNPRSALLNEVKCESQTAAMCTPR